MFRPIRIFRQILCLPLVWAFLTAAGDAADDIRWQELKGTHFLIYYIGEERFARDVLNKAEGYYSRIADELGYARYQGFWTWDKRCKIYIYPDHDSFSKASLNQPEWAEGMAEYKSRSIYSYAWKEGFLESLLPHEMTHLIFRDFIGFPGEIPLWLDEGIAQWEEEARRPSMKAMAKKAYEEDGFLTVNDMMRLDIRYLPSRENVYIRAALSKGGEHGVVLLSGENLIKTYYLEAASMIGFMIERYGGETFTIFCRELRDGKDFENAIRSAYPNITSVKDFEERWKEYLDKL
ncbi:MAG: hypothetical protein HZA28_04735 [Candidatus Omnitrophica bacterium]|nr:hypothetical protein [Candidatus Omnitrophota bacterium]